MLRLEKKKLHRVGAGQSLSSVADTYKIPVRALARENGLVAEPKEGEILILPEARGNYYTVRAGDERAVLCGSKENYEKKNGGILYPQMKVWL